LLAERPSQRRKLNPLGKSCGIFGLNGRPDSVKSDKRPGEISRK